MSNITAAIAAGIAAQKAQFARLETWEFGTCRHCWKKIHKRYFHFRHDDTGTYWCYEKKSIRRWKNTGATPATEVEIAKRIIQSYE